MSDQSKESKAFRKDLETMVWYGRHPNYRKTIGGRRYIEIYRKGQGLVWEPMASISIDDLITVLPGSATQSAFETRRKAERGHMSKASTGRTIVEAAAAGDAYQVETIDGKHHLFMPGSRGIEQTLRSVRKHWKNRIGQRVRIYRVLPGSRTGAMILEEAGERTL